MQKHIISWRVLALAKYIKEVSDNSYNNHSNMNNKKCYRKPMEYKEGILILQEFSLGKYALDLTAEASYKPLLKF